MKYFKRFWDKTEGELHLGWGSCTFYFETDDTLYPTRQINHFEFGKVLKYDSINFHDEFGMIADHALDLTEFKEFEISKDEFEAAWLA